MSCKHGQLKRVCDVCEIEQHNAELEATNARLFAENAVQAARIAELEADIKVLEAAHDRLNERSMRCAIY